MAVTMLIGFNSCNEVAKLVDFGIPMTFEDQFVMNISSTDDNVFEDVIVVDASGNQEVKDNLSNIANFDIGKLAYKVTSFTGDDAIVGDGFVQFFNDEGNIGDPVSTGQIAFRQLADSGNEVEIPIDNDLKKILEDKLLSDQIFSMRFYGTVSDKPMQADISVFITVEAKVKF